MKDQNAMQPLNLIEANMKKKQKAYKDIKALKNKKLEQMHIKTNIKKMSLANSLLLKQITEDEINDRKFVLRVVNNHIKKFQEEA